jgi:heptaprenyl diphosphate synthase
MGSFWSGYPELARDLEEVKGIILSQTISPDAEVQRSIHGMVESNAKMLRPGFVLLASRFGTPEKGKICRIAAAIEMLHMATLVHDDIIDEAPLRRGLPTLAARHGPRAAVLAGDSLFARCFTLVADYAQIEEVRNLSRVIPRICESESEQSGTRFEVSTSVRRYLRRIAGKTALLFALSFFVGARESVCSEALCFRLRRIGYAIGMGFQVIDDLLNIEGSGRETGKPIGSDISQGIYTLPTVLALRRDTGGDLRRALAKPQRSPRAVRKTVKSIREKGGIEGAKDAADRYTRRALRDISLLPDTPSRSILSEAAANLLTRRS